MEITKMMENKNSYFSLDLEILTQEQNDTYMDDLDNSVDLILSSMGADDDSYQFEKKDKSRIIYFFKTSKRKRQGQLSKFSERFLPKDQAYKAKGITKDYLHNSMILLEKDTRFSIKNQGKFMGTYDDQPYTGSDIKIFDDRSNWYPWQKEIYDLVLDSNGDWKQPHQRHIISLIDKNGNSGKSSFFKWLYFYNTNTIGRLGYGSSSQLKSSIVSIGKKDLYIIDLARSKSKNDSQQDLLSVVEDLKSGLVINAMYGAGKCLMISPPHLIICSNYLLDYKLLSADRWQVYEIKNNKHLGPVNKLLKQTKTNETIKN
jgi:hypothetical protein